MSKSKTMLTRLVVAGALGSLIAPASAAMVGGYKTPDNFLPLEAYASVEDFEQSYASYVQTCLDNTGGGSATLPCYIGYEMWDRELNTYYQKLMRVLDEESQSQLRDSQRKWIAMRDASIEFNSAVLDRKYTEPGTMYQAMRASDADAAITPLVKQRTLSLKRWYEGMKVGSEPQQKPETVSTTPVSIADKLYAKYGTINTVKEPFDRQKQAELVRDWTAQYATNTHPLGAMERMIRSGYSMNSNEIRQFGCEKLYFGGYKCTDLQQGSGYMMLNGKKQATSGDMCMPLPEDLGDQFRAFGGQRMVDFVYDLFVLAYDEQSSLFAYRRVGDDVCAKFEI